MRVMNMFDATTILQVEKYGHGWGKAEAGTENGERGTGATGEMAEEKGERAARGLSLCELA